MKMTPIVGEMKASDMANALGSPSALRRSSLVVSMVPFGMAIYFQTIKK
jgi:hypothetical protein